MTYKDSGYDGFLDRSIGVEPMDGLEAFTPDSISFDQVEVGGSLGDTIQVGGNRVRLEGSNGRIMVSDENGIDRIGIGNI